MVFRVSNAQTDLQFLIRNRSSREDESKTLERLSTLKKVNRASDDPEHYNRIRDAKSDISQTASFKDSIANTLSQFTIIEDALGGIREAITDARSIVVRGTSHLSDAEERITIADELAQLRLTIMNRLNLRSEGQYVFSGTDVNTQPFQDPTTGLYSGNTDAQRVRVSTSDTLQTNFDGSEIAFGTGGQGSAGDVLDALADLETGFRNNDLAQINLDLPRLEPIQERVNSIISEVGTRSQRLVFEQTHYETYELSLTAVLAELEDADLAEEAVNLDQVQNVLQAQLRSQGTINRQSLLNYLS